MSSSPRTPAACISSRLRLATASRASAAARTSAAARDTNSRPCRLNCSRASISSKISRSSLCCTTAAWDVFMTRCHREAPRALAAFATMSSISYCSAARSARIARCSDSTEVLERFRLLSSSVSATSESHLAIVLCEFQYSLSASQLPRPARTFSGGSASTGATIREAAASSGVTLGFGPVGVFPGCTGPIKFLICCCSSCSGKSGTFLVSFPPFEIIDTAAPSSIAPSTISFNSIGRWVASTAPRPPAAAAALAAATARLAPAARIPAPTPPSSRYPGSSTLVSVATTGCAPKALDTSRWRCTTLSLFSNSAALELRMNSCSDSDSCIGTCSKASPKLKLGSSSYSLPVSALHADTTLKFSAAALTVSTMLGSGALSCS